MNKGQTRVANCADPCSERRQRARSIGVVDPRTILLGKALSVGRYEHTAGCFAEDALGDALRYVAERR
jgi:hypothetical protein